MISFQIKPWFAFGLLYLLIELFYIGMPVVQRTVRRAVSRLVYGHVITKFSRMGRLPHELCYNFNFSMQKELVILCQNMLKFNINYQPLAL